MKTRSFLSSMSFVFFLFSILAIAAVLVLAPIVVHAGEIDTEHLFVFAIGTDIGEVGERELESETNSRFGKRTGSYTALSQGLEAEFTPIENFRLSIGGSLAYHNIAGVNGFSNRRQGSFEAVFLDMRYRFLDREHSIFGLTVAAEPQWGRIDETSGEPGGQYGLELAVAVDKEVVPDHTVVAVNFLYGFEGARSRATGVWSRESTLGVAAALMMRVHPRIFVGTEARYLRTYDGLGLNAFAGHAVFLGPSVFAKLPGTWWMAAGWSTQVAGRAAGDPDRLDLTNFERHQATFKFGFTY
jgi:hypothetical protein